LFKYDLADVMSLYRCRVHSSGYVDLLQTQSLTEFRHINFDWIIDRYPDK